MPSFDWIKDQPFGPNGEVIVEVIRFLSLSGIEDEDFADHWVDEAHEWGLQQSPVIDVGWTQDKFGVVLRKLSRVGPPKPPPPGGYTKGASQ